MNDTERLAALIKAIQRAGFKVIEGQFYMTDGTTGPYYLKPVDAKALQAAAIRASMSR